MGLAVDNIQAVGQIGPISPNAPYTTVAYVPTLTLTNNTNNRITCNGNITINPPTSSSDGGIVRLWLIAPSSGSSVTATLNSSIKIPTSSSSNNVITILPGIKALVSIQYDASISTWQLSTLINGYSGY
jgi:hypothetical protein